ncbi:M24 family metallopeptidase [Salipaludibacillus aurantiacus]|uniref:Xaa-Pro dipeptidase n=1 Tax=Salipaludibacillus aurantiacus TaxID=1601833 RepID=A0A1H9WPH0_9BACI|nr:Xaa-Pro peptidase family protein [Salipaludibacillus aurantiacus]SES35765.1 Xaa-Pro dipeptidase [Salipaludibacillus aurantiacus]
MHRLKNLQEKLIEKNADVLIVQTRPNVYYLSGFDTDPHERLVAVFILKNHPPFLVCPHMEVNQVQSVFTEGKIIGYSDTDNPWEKIAGHLSENNIDIRTAAVESSISWARMQALELMNNSISFIEADSMINELRVIKNDSEIAILKEAASLADKGIEAGVAALKEGVTEMEVLASIEYFLKKRGIREMSFSTMVLFGGNGGDPHGNPGDRTLRKGDGVLFDLGVVWKGYSSDITRTVFFDHVKEDDRKIYTTVLHAQQKALSLCQPGESVSLLDKVARSYIEQAGYGSYFPHRIGHGLGIEVHEFPSLSAENHSCLKEGMVFTIEPGIYIPDQTGVRIEDDVLITKEGHQLLTAFPKELTIIPS